MRKDPPLRIFCSYSSKDSKLRRELENHLSALKLEGLIEVWSDREILPGGEGADEIDENLEKADIILFLVSSDFLASPYCMAIEVLRAMDRHREGTAEVIPIVLRKCDWTKLQFGHLNALPVKGKPIKTLRGVNEDLCVQTALGIRKVVEKMIGASASPERPSEHEQSSAEPAPPQVSAASPGFSQVLATLPYVCNQREQEAPLEKALAHHIENAPQRPFVCVVPGEASESHEGYLTRLLTYTFPRILRSAADRELGDPEYLEWPGFARDERAAVESFESAIAEQLGCPAAEAAAVLHARRGPGRGRRR